MDIDTQLAQVSRTWLADYPRKVKAASRLSQSERHHLTLDYQKHMTRYQIYMGTRADAKFWVVPLPEKKAKKKAKVEEETETTPDETIDLPENVASDLYLEDADTDVVEFNFD